MRFIGMPESRRFCTDEVFPTFGRIYELDYLLLDARSGVSSFSNFALGICDMVVIVGRADRQHRTGLRRTIVVCRSAGKPFCFVLSGCPSPERNEDRIEQFAQDVGYRPDFVVPYADELYFNESILVRQQPNSALVKE